MRAIALLVVLVLAKTLVLAGRDISLSPWAPLAYLWQDLVFVLAFACLEALLPAKASWTLYGIAALYIAINVPIACTLSTPLTWPMLRAARGPLADSIIYYATPANGIHFGVMLVAAGIMPWLLRRSNRRGRIAVLAACAVIAPLGPLAARHVETLGLNRNVFWALAQTALPRIAALEANRDWRASPFGSLACDDLSRFRGRAAGRNVVIIHLESTSAEYLKPYGADEDPMPHLTALCEQAILFENAYTTYPETIRSFFAVHCATFPALDTEAEAYARVRAPALAEVLHSAEYRCGLFHSGRFGYLGMESVIRDRGFDMLEDAGDIGGERESSFGIDEESTVRRMLAWVDTLPPGQRFCLTYLPIAGHHPYATPRDGPFPITEEIDRYRNALHYADAAVDQLLRGLRQRGHWDDTLVVIFGDHGEAFGQHAGNFGHVLFLHEENVRVPYVIFAPGLIDEPIRVRRVASLVDTAPTVLDLLGMSAPASWQGRSLLDGHERLALFCTDYSLAFAGLRDGRWKFIYELDSDRSKLFDLGDDPDERINQADQHPERMEAYRDHVRAWCSAQKRRILKGD